MKKKLTLSLLFILPVLLQAQISKPGYQAPAKKTTPVYNGPKKLSGNSKILIVFDAKGTLKVDYQLIGSFNSGEAYNSPIGAGAHIITYSNGTYTWESTVENKSGQQLIVKTELTATEEQRRAEAAEAARFGSFTDPRDGQVYKTIKIDGQVWMSENLNYNSSDSWCYDNAGYNCDKYGRHYTWEAAKKGCPTGWHLPSDAEWSTLVNYYGGEMKAGANLKEGGSAGFNASLGGYTLFEEIDHVGEVGRYWSSSASGENGAVYRSFYSGEDKVYRSSRYRGYPQSVRCLQD